MGNYYGNIFLFNINMFLFLSFADRINTMFSICFFCSYFFSGIGISLLGIYFVITDNGFEIDLIKFVALLFCYIVHAYLLSAYGNELTTLASIYT